MKCAAHIEAADPIGTNHRGRRWPWMSLARRRLAAYGAAFALMAATAGPPLAQGRVEIVALGASNTEGWGLSLSQAYPARLQALLMAKGINATVSNAGIAGDSTGGMLARLDHAVPAGTQIVILQPGTNDERMGTGAERSANIEKVRSRLAARNIKLLLVENAMLDALPRSELRDDGVHFTPAGYAILAERILPQVLAALGQ
jgi:acyl-CoA thioesterase I